MKLDEFVVEGHLQLGPMEKYFLFLDGEHLGPTVARRLGISQEQGFTDLGYVRITIEQLEEPQSY